MSLKGQHAHQEWAPYVGARPFRRDAEEQKLFFGREHETENIISLIYSHKIVLIYAQSGAGKTSIFNASIVPALEARGLQVLPLTRVGIGSRETDSNHANSIVDRGSSLEVNPYVLNTIQSLVPEVNDHQLLNSTSLSSFLHNNFQHKINLRGKPLPQLIIFDQLEELFNLYSDPNRWHQQQECFFKQVTEAVEKDPLLRVVFIIREDYLAQLDPFVDFLPEKLKARFRLERLHKDAAFQAVKAPLEIAKGHIDEKLIDKVFDEGIIDKLIEDLVKIRVETFGGKSQEIKGEFVEPIQLQVVCLRLWNKLKFARIDQINQDYFGDSGDVDKALEDFYEYAIREASKTTTVDEDLIRNWFGEYLITSSETRGIVHRGFEETGGIPNRAIEILDNVYHIVRKEERSGAKWYELTHDRLIKPIMNSNKKWKNALEKEKDKAFSELWQKAIAINARKISTNQLENLDQDKILAVFYEEVIKQAIKKTRISEDHLRRWFEKTLITSTGTLAVTPRGLDSTAGMINTVLDFLEERSVITGKLRFGTKWYELSHDRLIQPIIESNKEWKQNSQLTKQLKKTKQKFAIISTVVAIAAITVVFLYFQSTIPQPSSACYPFKTETLNPDAFLKIGSPPNLLSIYPKNNYLMFVEENKNSPIISILNCQSYKPKFNITTRGEILDYTFDESKNMLYVANVNGISIYNLHDPTRSIASIPIIYPSALSINPSENRLYVASKNTNSVTIFDIANKKLVQNFTSDKGINLPDDIEFNSFDNKIYVANSGSNSVSVIDEKNNNSSTINTCDQKYCRNDGPHRLSINNHLNKIYMSNYPNHTISVINGNNYAVKNILVGRGPSDLAYDAKNDLLYVLNNLSNSISVIDGASDRVTRVIPLAVEISPVSIAVDPDSGLVYLASDDIYGSIRIIGPVENADYIQIGLDPKYLGLNNVTRKLYVSNYDTGKITVLNENTAASKDIKLFPPPSSTIKIIANDKTNKIYVATVGSYVLPNTVSIINGNNDTLRKILYFNRENQPISIAVNTNTNKVYVATINSSYIDIIDGKSDNLSDRHIDIRINSSHQVAVNALTNKIYVINPGSEILSVIDGNNDSLTKNVTLQIEPTAIAIDEKNNLVYLYSSSSRAFYNFAIVNGSNDIPTSGRVDEISGPAKLAIDPKSHHIFVLAIQAEKIVELYRNNENLKIVRQFPAGIDPIDFLIDDLTNKMYISNQKLNAILVTNIRIR